MATVTRTARRRRDPLDAYQDLEPTPRIERLRAEHVDAVPRVCTERGRLITEFMKHKGLFAADHIPLDIQGELYGRLLAQKTPIVRHTVSYVRGTSGLVKQPIEDPQLFAGSTTSAFRGVPLYPELTATAI